MPPLEPRDHRISLAQAAQFTRRHRVAGSPAPTIRAGAYYKESVLALLNQPGCTGMRIYLGHDENGQTHFVSVGVDQAGNDMVNGDILEVNYPCPPFCSAPNALNT